MADASEVRASDAETAEISADLPVELQSKLFDQMATFGIGGAGLTITLAGSLLRDAPPILVWLAAIEFGLASLISLAGQNALIIHLYEKRPHRRSSKVMTGIASMLIGMGAGSLATSVALMAKPVDAPTELASPRAATDASAR